MTICFLIESRFTKPFDTFGDAVAEHRAHLQQGYDQGWLLLSGPKSDRSGGFILARGNDPEMLQSFFDADPYRRKGLAEYRLSPFDAVKYATCLEDWLNPA